MALSDNAIYANTGLVLQAGFRRSRTHLALSDNAIYAACIIGIVWQCQICSYQPGITSGFSQKSHTFGIVRQCHLCSLHNWHCLTMPNMLIPAWYYKWVFAELAHIWHCLHSLLLILSQYQSSLINNICILFLEKSSSFNNSCLCTVTVVFIQYQSFLFKNRCL